MDKNSLQYQLYKLDNENEINAVIKDETIWLTQKSMSELFGVRVPAISKHLNNIFESGELDDEVVISKMETTTQHGALTDKTQRIDSDYEKEIVREKGGLEHVS